MRKPITTEMAGGKTPRQRIWELIRGYRHGGEFELLEVTPGTVNIGTARSYVVVLEKAGIVTVASQTPSGKKTWTLARDMGLEAPRVDKHGATVTQGNGNECMWRTMRIIGGSFTAAQLAGLASTGDSHISEQTAKTYCAALAKAGYLAIESKGKGLGAGGKPTVYRFIPARHTGPRAPMIPRDKAVYDPNLHQVVWPTPDAVLTEADRHGLA